MDAIQPAPASPTTPARSTHIVLYDGDCSLCTFQMRLITWLDWLNKVSLVPIAHPQAAQVAPTLTPAQLHEAIHCVTPENHIHRGARAIRFLSFRLPLLIPVGIILWIPGVIWIAERMYQWVSRNRYLLSRIFGCKGACAVMPVRERENEKSMNVPAPAPAPRGGRG